MKVKIEQFALLLIAALFLIVASIGVGIWWQSKASDNQSYQITENVDGLSCIDATLESPERGKEVCGALLRGFEKAEKDVENGTINVPDYWLKRATYLAMSDRDLCEKLSGLERLMEKIGPDALAQNVSGRAVSLAYKKFRDSEGAQSC